MAVISYWVSKSNAVVDTELPVDAGWQRPRSPDRGPMGRSGEPAGMRQRVFGLGVHLARRDGPEPLEDLSFALVRTESRPGSYPPLFRLLAVSYKVKKGK